MEPSSAWGHHSHGRFGKTSSGATSKITAYYFGDSKSDKWLAADSIGQVRVYNALSDCSDLDVSLENADGDVVNLATGQTFKDLSSYEDVSTKSVVWSAIPSCNTGSTIFDGLGQLVNVEDGQSWSVIFFGGGTNSSPEFSSAIAVPEETTIFTNKSSLTFTNAAYVADETKRKPYNIHVTTTNEGVTAASVDIPLLGYAQYGLTTLNAGIKYVVTATDETNKVAKAQPLSLTTEGGENIHLVIHEKVGGGYEIVRLIGEAAASKTTVVADKNSALADGVDKITLTIQVRDFGGNKITSSSGVVALSTTSTAIVSTPALDNADGSYTAEVTNTVAETVVIDGTLDGDDIPSITLTFN